jgi:hypothetical protein
MFVPYYDEFHVYLTQDDVINFIENQLDENENIEKEDLYKKCINYFGKNYDSLILEILDCD